MPPRLPQRLKCLRGYTLPSSMSFLKRTEYLLISDSMTDEDVMRELDELEGQAETADDTENETGGK